jgi:hypothetical protein
MFGAVGNSELAWVLGVPYNVITDHLEPQTRLIVQPSRGTWARLTHHHLTDRTRSEIPRGWRVIADDGEWQIYAAGVKTPVSLR